MLRSLRLRGTEKAGRSGVGPVLAAVAAIALCGVAAGGCGDDDEDGNGGTEAVVTTDHVPGSPPEGAPDYEGLGTWWSKLGTERRVASAEEFIADNPADCADVKPAELEQQTTIAYGYDFPEATRVSDVMLETCAVILAP